jgi:hypothetical protein
MEHPHGKNDKVKDVVMRRDSDNHSWVVSVDNVPDDSGVHIYSSFVYRVPAGQEFERLVGTLHLDGYVSVDIDNSPTEKTFLRPLDVPV